MKTYKILWIDDEYTKETIFNNIIENTNRALSNYGISLEVKWYANIQGKIDDDLDSGEYRLLVTDIKIGQDTHAYTMPTKLAEKKKIPYIIYSSHTSNLKKKN